MLSWLNCFSLYVAVSTPHKTRELWAYQAMMVTDQCRCSGGGWLLHDSGFRQQLSSLEAADFSMINQSLYTTSFLVYGERGLYCPHSLASDHAQEDCALHQRAVPVVRFKEMGSSLREEWRSKTSELRRKRGHVSPGMTAGAHSLKRHIKGAVALGIMRPCLLCPTVWRELGSYPSTRDLIELLSRKPRSIVHIPSVGKRIQTPLVLGEWREWLGQHPDRAYAEYLLQGVKEGFRIGFKYCVGCTNAKSIMQSAMANPTVVDAYLEKEVGLGRVIGSLEQYPMMHVSRFGVRSKNHTSQGNGGL